MKNSTSAPDGTTPTRQRVLRLGGASLLAALFTWALTALAGRTLGPVGYAAFMVLWGFNFLETGLLLGVQQEVTRAVATVSRQDAHRMPGASITRLAILIGGAGAALLLVSSPAWGEKVFGAGWQPIALATAGGFVFYAVYNAVNGTLAGRERWTHYSLSIAAEGFLRFATVALALALGGGRASQSWALATAGLAWLVLMVLPGFRTTIRAVGDGPLHRLGSGAAHSMIATGCSAVLIAGFPVLLKATAPGPLGPQAGVVLAAVVATRAPLLLPLNAFSAMILARFVVAGARMWRTLSVLVATVLVVTVVGALLAYSVGPWLLQVVYGSDFLIRPWLIALLVVAAGLLTVQTLSGAAVLALGRYRVYALGWVLATVVAVSLLSTPLGVGPRTVLALILGPVVGVAVNTAAVTLSGLDRHAS